MQSIDKKQIKAEVRELAKALKEKMKLLEDEKIIKIKNDYKKTRTQEQRLSPKVQQNKDRYENIVYRFPCPECQSIHTKRTGTTTQLNPKARYICLDCQDKFRKTNDKSITPFFVMSNEEMELQINNDMSLSRKDKEYYLERYLIKR